MNVDGAWLLVELKLVDGGIIVVLNEVVAGMKKEVIGVVVLEVVAVVDGEVGVNDLKVVDAGKATDGKVGFVKENEAVVDGEVVAVVNDEKLGGCAEVGSKLVAFVVGAKVVIGVEDEVNENEVVVGKVKAVDELVEDVVVVVVVVVNGVKVGGLVKDVVNNVLAVDGEVVNNVLVVDCEVEIVVNG